MLDCAVCVIWGIGLHRTLEIQPKPSLRCRCSPVGFNADSVIDRISKTLLTAKIPLGRLDGDVAQQKLDLVQVPSGIAAQTRAGPRSCGAKFSIAALLAQSLTTCQTALSDTPGPQVLPARQTHRNTRPSLRPAETSQESMELLTQSGTGTVRM